MDQFDKLYESIITEAADDIAIIQAILAGIGATSLVIGMTIPIIVKAIRNLKQKYYDMLIQNKIDDKKITQVFKNPDNSEVTDEEIDFVIQLLTFIQGDFKNEEIQFRISKKIKELELAQERKIPNIIHPKFRD